MQDLEENLRILSSKKNKLQDLGDSLWHTKFRNNLKNLRSRNNKTRILGRKSKFKQGVIKNKKHKRKMSKI